MTYTAAAAALQAVGLVAVNPDGMAASTIVANQDPYAGLTEYLGQTVVLEPSAT
jgi:hypothetical protein